VELGGTDQLFNLLVGRDLMREYALEPQVVMTMPLLEGLDGIEKMSKSLGNYIGIDEEPDAIFGKIMSISDELMWKYYLLCTDLRPAEIEEKKREVGEGRFHPMQAKRDLARIVITEFHDAAAAERADAEFTRIFSERQAPSEVEEKTLPASDEPQLVSKVLVTAGAAPSNSEARRLLAQGGVYVDDVKVDDSKATLDATTGRSYYLKVGKRRFVRVRFE
jgi:tyrosyl-tRNA synthetase